MKDKSDQNHKVAAQEERHQCAMQQQIPCDSPALAFRDKMHGLHEPLRPHDADQHYYCANKYEKTVGKREHAHHQTPGVLGCKALRHVRLPSDAAIMPVMRDL